MAIVLGIESTAHTFGIGIVKDGKVLVNIKKNYTTKQGGIIPVEAAKHHQKNKYEIYFEALDKSGINEKNICAIAFSQGPGLAPCLLEGMRFAKELSEKLKKPVVPVNHCIAHLEIGKITGANDPEVGSPVMLYVSGANTQIIAYASGKYRVFGETLDVGVGNFIDNFARYAGIGFPGGPAIEKLALNGTPQAYPEKSSTTQKVYSERKNFSTRGKIFTRGKKYIELPYKVKGMDIALSGILTNLKQKLEKKDTQGCTPKNIQKNIFTRGKYTLSDLAYSMQETVFAMLVETAERALAHTGKKELLLGGGVACNSRLQEMCRIMCRERGAKLFVPPNNLLTDNGAMIAFLGEIMFNAGIKVSHKDLDKIDIEPRQRTDEVQVVWRK